MEIGTEISKKIRAAIKTKLEELGAYVDEELPDYIMVMVANKKTQEQMQTDLSLFLGDAADSFTDWLSQLLSKLQNITAETLEKQFKAQQKAEKTGQGSNSTKVLMSLEQKKKSESEANANGAGGGGGKKVAKLAPDQPLTGDYIAIQTDDVIEGLDEEEVKSAPPTKRSGSSGGSRPNSAGAKATTTASRPHSSTSKKSNDVNKEPPSLVEARQALDDALRKKRAAEGKVEMPKKLLKTSSSSTVAGKRHQKEVDSSTKSSSKTQQSPPSKPQFTPGSVLKQRDVDEDGRIIGSIVKVTDKKGKSLLQSKVSATSGSKIASSSSRVRSSAAAASSSRPTQSLSSQVASRGLRSDDMRHEKTHQYHHRDRGSDNDFHHSSNSRGRDRDSLSPPPPLEQRPSSRNEQRYQDYDRATRGNEDVPRTSSLTASGRVPESRMYSDRSEERAPPTTRSSVTAKQPRDRSREYDPLSIVTSSMNARRDQEDASSSRRHDHHDSGRHDGRHHSSRSETKMEPPSLPPPSSSFSRDSDMMAPPPPSRDRSGGGGAGPGRLSPHSQKTHESRRRQRSRDDGNADARSRSRSGEAENENDKGSPRNTNPAFVLKKDNGKTVTVTRAHLQSFKVHIKNRKRHPSDEISCAVDNYSVMGGDTDEAKGGGMSPPPLPPPPAHKDISDEPEPYEEEEEEEDLYDNRRGEQEEEEVPIDYEDDRVDERMSETNVGSPARYSDVEEDHDIPSSPPAPVRTNVRSIRNVRPKSPTLYEDNSCAAQEEEEEEEERSPQEDENHWASPQSPEQRVRSRGEHYPIDKRRFRAEIAEVEGKRGEEEPAPPYESDAEEEEEDDGKKRESIGDSEPVPPGTEARILLPHEKAEEKRKAKEKRAREKVERREMRRKKAAEEAANAAAATAAAAAAAAAARPVKASTATLRDDLENSDWHDIVSRALQSRSEESLPSDEFPLSKEPVNTKTSKPKKLKRPPPPSAKVLQQQQQPPQRPHSANSNEAPKFTITFTDDRSKTVETDRSTSPITKDLGEEGGGAVYDEDEDDVRLDGFAEDDVFIYIDEDDIEYHPSLIESGSASPLALSYVPSNQTLYSASDLSIHLEKNDESASAVATKATKSSSRQTVTLPVRAQKPAAVTAVSKPVAKTPKPVAKTTASVVPRISAPIDAANQFSWQNPAKTRSASNGDGVVASLTSTNTNKFAVQTGFPPRANVAPARPAFQIPRRPIRQVAVTAPLPVTGTAHSNNERCRFWPACRSGESCPFQHPTKACKAFPKCNFGDKCLFIHPNCKYDASCTKVACPFTHASKRGNLFAKPIVKTVVVPANRNHHHPGVPSAETAMPCRYGNGCTKLDCVFTHPRDNSKRGPPRLVGRGGEMSTEMAEKILNFPTKLVWKKD